MYYEKHVPSSRLRRCRRTLAVLLVLFVIAATDMRLRPVVKTMLTAQARTAFTEAVGEAVLETVSGSDAAFVKIEYGEDNVSAVTTDPVAVNLYKSRISAAVADKINDDRSEPVKVPIGTLTGVELLTGRGPCVRLRLIEKGSVTADLQSTFSEAGINQTCHRIVCRVSADYYAVIPGFSTPVTLSADVIVAESVIVGEVPDSFTYVYGDQSDTVGRIFDYGDPYGNDVLGQ